MTQPLGGAIAGSGSSRSPSPAPPAILQASPASRQHHPLPAPPSTVLLPPVMNLQPQHHPNGSSHTLAPPPAAPHGPRRPSPARSRSPSPDGGARRSVDIPSRNGASATPTSHGRLDTLKRGMSKLGLDVRRTRSGSLTNGAGKSRKSGEVPHVDDDEDTVQTPIQPSAKALGKRRAETPPEEGVFILFIFSA